MSGLRIGSNIASLVAQRRLAEHSGRLLRIHERLASGQRINHSSDDAAGLAISSKLLADTRIHGQAVRNVDDGAALARIAEGALDELKSISYRHLELANQAANGVYSLKQRNALDREAKTLVEEYNRIVASVSFNGRQLFADNASAIQIQAGVGTNNALSLALGGSLSRTVGDGTFSAGQSFSVPHWPNGVAAADFDGDGNVDLVCAENWNDAVISVFLGNGDGTFEARHTFNAAGYMLQKLYTADVNNDQRSDIIGVSGGTVATFMGKGDGTFESVKLSTQAANNIDDDAALGDLNGDGKIDIAAVDHWADKVVLFLGRGDGTFQLSQAIDVGDWSRGISIGDMNGDEKPDIVAAGHRFISVLLGDGRGSFSLQPIFDIGVDAYMYSIALSDFNCDGMLDAAVGDGLEDDLYILWGDGEGSFASKQAFTIASSPRQIFAVDLNGDGRQDLVSSNWNPWNSVLIGRGDGTFDVQKFAIPGQQFDAAACADFNNDGAVDIACTDEVADKINLTFGRPRRTSAAAYLNLNTRRGALEALCVAKSNLQRVQSEQGVIGAGVSRFAVARNSLQASIENESSAAWRITDSDIPEASASLVKEQILQSAGAAVLAQANQQPALVIELLRNA